MQNNLPIQRSLTLIKPLKFHLLCKITQSQVPGIRVQISLGGGQYSWQQTCINNFHFFFKIIRIFNILEGSFFLFNFFLVFSILFPPLPDRYWEQELRLPQACLQGQPTECSLVFPRTKFPKEAKPKGTTSETCDQLI